mmetsp:Transcript_30450/g.72107  ORF Transcript_30450/g.72107 Transcript_30450/m.72107 type:complete len:253 (-) Transcript_30450:1176-1934(-)
MSLWAVRAKGIARTKQVATFGCEEHVIEPSIASTIFLVIASPSPVPPCWRAKCESTWEKGLKRRESLSAGMPLPLSRTSSVSIAVLDPSVGRSTVPFRFTTPPNSFANLTALSQRLIRHCRSRNLSPRMDGSVCGMSTANSTSRDATREETMSTSSSHRVVRWKGSSESLISSAPALSTLAYSRTWLMIPRRASADVSDDRTYSSWRVERPESRRREEKAMTELRGVRSSWEMFATKRRESRDEASASITAS